MSRICNAYVYLKYSGTPDIGTCSEIPPSWSCSANNRRFPKIFGEFTTKEFVLLFGINCYQ